ncbi:MAG: hypothetical protein A3J46_02250 [Candidatus Yanofskybacteria bacterium RIFCSPHIGHO2_02_FULL_41_11]|uniref:Uncharacterized protein n=1 Tax=Candidatus Yanofskybacteria bacterium RIFCSPHIGHO2_02_FULL_41_11 TaxID=1802675 RepID=A0A1F8F8P8_9BACT|nr:MAG: hypothetical protein A3J46_02250 [Candidatus Yanofskybacteria bacterium RIFCSPHIGHO2_02_FULL_41_11]
MHIPLFEFFKFLFIYFSQFKNSFKRPLATTLYDLVLLWLLSLFQLFSVILCGCLFEKQNKNRNVG